MGAGLTKRAQDTGYGELEMPGPNGWDASGDRDGAPSSPAAPAPQPPPSADAAFPPPGAPAPPADPGTGAARPGAAASEPVHVRVSLADADLLGGDIPFRPLSISEMLDAAIACIRRHPRATLGLSIGVSTVIQVLGSLLAYYFIGPEAREEITPGVLVRSIGTQFILGAIGLVLSAYGILLVAGLLSPLIGRQLLGLPTSPRQAWRDARPRMGRLAAVAALIVTGSLAALVLPNAPLLLLIAAEGPVEAIIIAGVFGVPAGLAAMVWVYVLLVPAVPAVVMERQNVAGALRRARTLSRGRWWRTCGTLLLALMITVFMGMFALRAPFLLVQLAVFGDAESTGASVGALAVDTLGRIVSWSVVLPFDAGVIALLYVDRRMRREGFDLELRTRTRPASAPGGGAPAADAPDGPEAADDGFFELWRPAPLAARPQPQQPPVPQQPAPQQPPVPQPVPQQPPQTWTST
ncbi:hypothetical protein Acsp04_05480 [Actinomadura sp. NBRC 104425]|nr:hypothetical protein Acsp04_05480 [Actinomadura sp. NBRC 104425]